MPDLGEAAVGQVGQQRGAVDHLLLVYLRQALVGRIQVSADDPPADEAVGAEIVQRLQMLALQEQVAVPEKDAVHTGRFDGREFLDDGFAGIVGALAGGGGEAGHHDLPGLGEADRKTLLTLHVVVGGMPGRADETKIIVVAQRHGHVLGSQVEAVSFAGADHHQGGDGEEILPNGLAGVQL